MNAPPGRPQRMGVFFLVSSGAPDAALADVLRYTNGDRFRALAGYKTLSTHWHLADTVQAMANGFDWTPPFKPVLKAMGVDASMIMDFHGDGHPDDLTDLRLDELHAYFARSRAVGSGFPADPGRGSQRASGRTLDARVSEAGVLVHGPARRTARSSRQHPKYGTVYSVGRRERDVRPRAARGRLHVPDASADEGIDRVSGQDPGDRLTSAIASYLGAGWKALPSDLSSPRLGDRAFDLLDELNNQGLRKRLLGEVDVFQFDHTHELYAHMNINYIKLDRLPGVRSMGRRAGAAGQGRLLHDHRRSAPARRESRVVVAPARSWRRVRAQWTFPLRFAEIVWGDGQTTHREVIELADTREFGNRAVRVASQGERLDCGPASRCGTSPATARS